MKKAIILAILLIFTLGQGVEIWYWATVKQNAVSPSIPEGKSLEDRKKDAASSFWKQADHNMEIEGYKFDLSKVFSKDVYIKDWNIESVIWRVVTFMLATISAFAILWIIVWWFMTSFWWFSEDVSKKWKMTLVYSSLWLAVAMSSYLIIKIVQLTLYNL